MTREESDRVEERLAEARRLTEEGQRLEADAWAGYLERVQPARERARREYEEYRKRVESSKQARRERERLAREARREEERARLAREEEEYQRRRAEWRAQRAREAYELGLVTRATHEQRLAKERALARAGNPDLMLSARETRMLLANRETERQGRLALAAQDYAEHLVRRIAPEVPFSELGEYPEEGLRFGHWGQSPNRRRYKRRAA